MKWLIALVFAIALSAPHALHAEDAEKPFKKEELDQMLAPIALYPDDLLTNVLVGATYPLEIVQAARWRKEPANAKLKGAALEKALESKDWDPSVKSLTQVPDVLQTMSDKLDWTQKLGDAFLAQQDDVMEEIQLLRRKADETGSLKTNKQQKVSKKENYIVIEPASPDVIYVPVYQPTVVYGSWWYPSYPPYYWYYGRPASAFVSGFFWGAGIAVAANIWDWGRCDWGRRDIDINVNKYNKINANRKQVTSNKWQHDPKHRGSVPYRDKGSREKFGKAGDKQANLRRDAAKDFRGFDDGKGRGARDKIDRGGADKVKDRPGDGAGQKLKDKAGGPAAKKVQDRPKAAGAGKAPKTAKKVSKPASRPSPGRSSAAFDVKRGSDVKRNVSRGHASRQAMAHRGGGGRSFGGGGRGGGGRRR